MISTSQLKGAARDGGAAAEPVRVLFLCIGNACRSQMAEGFARAYGSDVIVPASAGLSPAMEVAPDTLRAMDEKDIDLRQQFPKSWRHVMHTKFDLVVNMSGLDAPPDIGPNVRVWKVRDPILSSYKEHCRVRDQIENLVMDLILELRRARKQPRK